MSNADAQQGAARAVETDPVMGHIDNAGAGGSSGGERAVPYHCPFCADEGLRPHEAAAGAWHCPACLRIFAVKYLGLDRSAGSIRPPGTPQSTLATPTAHVEIPGASR